MDGAEVLKPGEKIAAPQPKAALGGGKSDPGAPPAPAALAEQIASALGTDLATAAKADPELWSQVSAKDLAAWIAEDTRAALAELAESGWAEDAR